MSIKCYRHYIFFKGVSKHEKLPEIPILLPLSFFNAEEYFIKINVVCFLPLKSYLSSDEVESAMKFYFATECLRT